MIFKPILKKMKTVQLKTVSERLNINNQIIETEIKYTDLMKLAINSPVQGGYSVSEMSQRIRLMDTIEKAEKTAVTEIQFEDTDYAVLAKLMKDAKWSVISKAIVEFVQEFDK